MLFKSLLPEAYDVVEPVFRQLERDDRPEVSFCKQFAIYII
jgi:hypothetical protein